MKQRYAELTLAEPALDDLLGEFMERGYQTEMKEYLQEIVNTAPTPLEIREIWVLPVDVDDLVRGRRNPFWDEDEYATEEEARANMPAFDLNNPEHCVALEERLFDLNC